MRYIFFLLLTIIGFSSCNKAFNDPDPVSYAGQDTLYCNDPAAINYNYEFPGTPDNATCIYPTDVFIGMFDMKDTIYTEDFASFYVVSDTINVYALSKTKMAIVGFCGPLDSIKLTANRYYRATIDTTIQNGQPLCSIKDTISGLFSVNATGALKIDFVLIGDTAGTKYHKGTATPIY